MERKSAVDTIDREIIRLLHGSGRLSQEQIARTVRLSRPAVHERLKRLQQTGVIRGYKALLDWEALGQPVTAFIHVRTKGKCSDTGHDIMKLRCANAVVEECHRITGEWCFLVKARAASPHALQELIDHMRDVPGVDGTMTTVALSTLGEEHNGHREESGTLDGAARR